MQGPELYVTTQYHQLPEQDNLIFPPGQTSSPSSSPCAFRPVTSSPLQLGAGSSPACHSYSVPASPDRPPAAAFTALSEHQHPSTHQHPIRSSRCYQHPCTSEAIHTLIDKASTTAANTWNEHIYPALHSLVDTPNAKQSTGFPGIFKAVDGESAATTRTETKRYFVAPPLHDIPLPTSTHRPSVSSQTPNKKVCDANSLKTLDKAITDWLGTVAQPHHQPLTPPQNLCSPVVCAAAVCPPDLCPPDLCAPTPEERGFNQFEVWVRSVSDYVDAHMGQLCEGSAGVASEASAGGGADSLVEHFPATQRTGFWVFDSVNQYIDRLVDQPNNTEAKERTFSEGVGSGSQRTFSEGGFDSAGTSEHFVESMSVLSEDPEDMRQQAASTVNITGGPMGDSMATAVDNISGYIKQLSKTVEDALGLDATPQEGVAIQLEKEQAEEAMEGKVDYFEGIEEEML
eukprot:GHVS01071422.1.p1 GENE.GHVS01071422.1~~GHVS01071422.1.p1  ORF type:complete len:457 (-),score=79.50 GHVS01071422.1:556-1926(-)